MSDIAICAEDLGKSYRIGEREPYYTLRDSLARLFTAPLRRFRNGERPRSPNGESLSNPSLRLAHGNAQSIWALKDVSFEVKRGEVVGVIGRNGAGKSTLLKILAEITEPSEGLVKINGRVGSLLEVGTGFHPELTGRENIYLNGAILGMKKAEISGKFDEIVAFAEIEKFLDTPVKHYSSGMYMRLAFAVAAHLQPDILLVDEVLAVGDATFQNKCLRKMGDVAKEGRTVLFVSHHLAMIQKLCDRSVLLDRGKVSIYGQTLSVVSRYLSSINHGVVPRLVDRGDRQGDGALRFVQFFLETESRGSTETVCTGERVTLVAKYESLNLRPLRNVSISIPFYDHMGQHMFMCWTRMTGHDFDHVEQTGEFRALIPKFPLMPGSYTINIWCDVNGILADWVREAAVVNVVEGDFFGSGYLAPNSHGGLIVDHAWDYVSQQ
jgi:lipopolysaccharide transport system ATP-binding protein